MFGGINKIWNMKTIFELRKSYFLQQDTFQVLQTTSANEQYFGTAPHNFLQPWKNITFSIRPSNGIRCSSLKLFSITSTTTTNPSIATKTKVRQSDDIVFVEDFITGNAKLLPDKMDSTKNNVIRSHEMSKQFWKAKSFGSLGDLRSPDHHARVCYLKLQAGTKNVSII